MFTGIIERKLAVLSVEPRGSSRRLTLAHPWTDLRPGESVAIAGVCLTVADLSPGTVAFDVVGETLAKTHLSRLAPGSLVNAERSLRLGDRIDGHLVQGHVDATAAVLTNGDTPTGWRLALEVPPDLAAYMIPKGSVTIDGVSLTIAAVAGRRIEIALIPTTLDITTLGNLRPGDQANIEADANVKTIVATVRRMAEAGALKL